AGDLVDTIGPNGTRAGDLELGGGLGIADTFLHGSSPPHLGGSVHHGTYDLVVAGAAAKVAREPVAHLGLGRVRSAVEQRLGRNEEAGGTDSALQGGMLEKLALQRMQRLATAHAFDGLDRLAVRLDAEHQARAYEAPIHHDAAGAAIAGAAAFLGARQLQLVAQDIEQRLLRLAERLDRIAVHRKGNVMLRHLIATSPARLPSAPPGAP